MNAPLQVLECERRLVAAMKSANADELDALLHDELLFNGPTGETATKALDLANYRSGNVRLKTVEPSDCTLSVIGDTAVVAVTVRIVGDYLGVAIDGRFRYLRVWKSFADRSGPAAGPGGGAAWKVIAGSVVPLAPKA